MKVEILSPGCANCDRFYANVQDLVKKQGIEAEVIKVEDTKVISGYGVFMMPALVIDGEVKIAGKIPGDSQLLRWLGAAE
ncbi:thioredoxin family protein [Thermodesulfobacteriota bacterium]